MMVSTHPNQGERMHLFLLGTGLALTQLKKSIQKRARIQEAVEQYAHIVDAVGGHSGVQDMQFEDIIEDFNYFQYVNIQ